MEAGGCKSEPTSLWWVGSPAALRARQGREGKGAAGDWGVGGSKMNLGLAMLVAELPLPRTEPEPQLCGVGTGALRSANQM